MLTLRSQEEQQAEFDNAVREAQVLSGTGLDTRFGRFQVVKRVRGGWAEYLLRAEDPAGRRLLTGGVEPFAKDLTITAVDDEDAARQALRLLRGLAEAAVRELVAACDGFGALDDTPAEAAALSAA